MSAETLQRDLHRLNRADILRAVQSLIDDFAFEEEFGIVPGAKFEVWSPHDSAEAVAILTKLLDRKQAKNP